ncbi:MAG: alkaline phosphatase family protein [Armatimonadetes bacterium]|nr:alkaline phosphatase family protein [Armatimonadota bacterium]
MNTQRRCMVIGLDSAAPAWLGAEWADLLPITHGLMSKGLHGRLESTLPPITCPAWMSMVTSKDPGQLGIYGFRNRHDYSYAPPAIATSADVREPALWDLLGRRGLRSVVVGVPPTYPPRPMTGWLVSDFLAPDTDRRYTHPDDLKAEIDEAAPGYQLDVREFRTEDKRGLLRQVYEMTDKRFQLLRHLLASRPWDFCMCVEIGVDRLYHGFWRYCSPDHRLYLPGNPFEAVLREYHAHLDQLIGELLARLGDDTLVMLVSDHGAKSMVGGICINEWLMREGYLTLKSQPTQPSRLDLTEIDWSRSVAWGEGGYYGRVVLNVAGREPHGIVPPLGYEALRSELASRLEALGDRHGRPIGTRVHKPEEVYREVRGIAPDLMVLFGDLDYRSIGTVGHGRVHVDDNDSGPDDSNHAHHGLFVLSDPHSAERGEVEGARIYDVAPTILERMGLAVPADMIGRPLHRRAA